VIKNLENKAMKATYENKAAVPIHGVPPGGKVTLDADDRGVPKGVKNREFRRRIAEGAFARVEDKPTKSRGGE